MNRVTDYLRAARSPDERRDRELLLAHVLRCNRAQLYAHPERRVAPDAIDELLERRARSEPIAYLTGRREFWTLELTVSPAVLIPRPETELLVELALAHLNETASVLDLGTGAGAIALAIASERPRCRVVACDISDAALDVARANGARLRLAVQWLHSDWYESIHGSFDVIVANPPYIAEHDPHLADLGYEPRIALVSGRDGLEALRIVVAGASRHLLNGGWLIVEHGHDQGSAVRDLFRAASLHDVTTHRDLAGRERATVGRR